jgi:hypothetical protein
MSYKASIQQRFFALMILALLALSLPACAQVATTPTSQYGIVKIPTFTPTADSPMAAATPKPESAGPLTWSGETPPLLMAHYMPWYQAPNVSGQWGWHWTMNHFSPTQGEDGVWTNFASHYTPLTGLYDSSDGAILDYQVQLMKLSGIDGVIVDWYGNENFWDYGTINASTQKLFEVIQRAGLKFAICYEDQTVKHMVDNSHIQEADAIAVGQEAMRYLQDTWFKDDAYLKVNGRPVLLTFGPQYFKNGEDWQELFSVTDPKPLLIALNNPTPGAATAAYPWPPMALSEGGVLSEADLQSYLDDFYSKAQGWQYKVAGVFPGFHDIYKEANVGAGYGFLDARDGKIFRSMFQKALDQDPDMIQLITWNDYGEGTIIEPTIEFGNRYLEMVQEARQAISGDNFTFTPEDLSLPYELYQLRQQYASDADVLAELGKASSAILAGDPQAAAEIMNAYR